MPAKCSCSAMVPYVQTTTRTKTLPAVPNPISPAYYPIAILENRGEDERKNMAESVAKSKETSSIAEPMTASEQHPGSGTDPQNDRGHTDPTNDKIETVDEDEEEDAEKRLARSRERNREHARRTRLRKKAQLEALQETVKGLEGERQALKQQIEECSIASILLGLSSGEQDETTQDLLDSTPKSDVKASKVALLAGGKRKRFVSDALGADGTYVKQTKPLKLKINGKMTVIGGGNGKSHINWKTGAFVDDSGEQQQLTAEQLETLRRERNRMHAKMTRDRKKCFIATIQKTIEELKADIHRMKAILVKVSVSPTSVASSPSGMKYVTPATSPELKPSDSPSIDNDEGSVYSKAADEEVGSHYDEDDHTDYHPPEKRACHGFSLDA